MNKRQRVALAAGVILVVLCGLFPPYEGEYPLEGDNLKAYMGYHFLFAPPSREQMMREIWGHRYVGMQQHAYRCRASIDTSRIYIQVLIVVAATAGLLLLLRSNEKPLTSNKTDARDGL